MAVLWRSMENHGDIDDGYQGNTAVLAGGMRDRNTFFEKHIRISATLPSDTDMKVEVKRVWGDRRKGGNALVQGSRGTRTKNEVYGKLTPAASGILFATTDGFMAINAWIDEYVNRSKGNWQVPIPGGAVSVSWSMETFTYEVINAGFLVLGIRVGSTADVEFGTSPYAEAQDIRGSMKSRVVYHMEPTLRGA